HDQCSVLRGQCRSDRSRSGPVNRNCSKCESSELYGLGRVLQGPVPFREVLPKNKRAPQKYLWSARRIFQKLRAYFRVLTYAATALASSAESPPIAFLCGAFLASSPVVSRAVIWSAVRAVPASFGPTLP